MDWGKFFKGFLIAVVVCVAVWLFGWIFRTLLDFCIAVLGAGVGLVLGIGGPVLLAIVLCIIFGVWYARHH